MGRYRAGIVAAILTIALFASASPARAADTHAQYIAEVDPICKEGSEAVKRALRKVRPKGDPLTDFIREVNAFQRVFKRTVKRISRIDRPPETADEIREWVLGLRRQKRLIDRYIAAAKRQQAARSIKLGKKVGKAQGQSVNRARRLDLKSCGRSANAGS